MYELFLPAFVCVIRKHTFSHSLPRIVVFAELELSEIFISTCKTCCISFLKSNTPSAFFANIFI